MRARFGARVRRTALHPKPRADVGSGVRGVACERLRHADTARRRESPTPDSHDFDRFGLVDTVARTFSLKFFSTARRVVFAHRQGFFRTRRTQKYFFVDRKRRR